MDKETIILMFWSFLLGLIATFLIIDITNNLMTRAQTLITECEQTLPRDQNCILQAIPDEKNI